jgi:hypothetical protein
MSARVAETVLARLMEHLFKSPLEGDFPPVDDVLVRWAEKKLGRQLPPSLVELLRQQNGGYLRRWLFPTVVKNYSGDGFVPVDYLAGISRDEDAHNSLLATAYMTREWGLPDGLVLLSGDGHTWIALDYRHGTAEPTVSFIDAEMGQEIPLAPTFSAFIDQLVKEDPAG